MCSKKIHTPFRTESPCPGMTLGTCGQRAGPRGSAGWLRLEARALAKMGRLLREGSRVSTSRLRQRVGPRCSPTSPENSVKKTGGQSKSRKWDTRPRRGPLPLPVPPQKAQESEAAGRPPPLPRLVESRLSRSLGRSPSQHRGQLGDVPLGSVAEGAAERPPTGSPEHIGRISAWGPVSTGLPVVQAPLRENRSRLRMCMTTALVTKCLKSVKEKSEQESC